MLGNLCLRQKQLHTSTNSLFARSLFQVTSSRPTSMVSRRVHFKLISHHFTHHLLLLSLHSTPKNRLQASLSIATPTLLKYERKGCFYVAGSSCLATSSVLFIVANAYRLLQKSQYRAYVQLSQKHQFAILKLWIPKHIKFRKCTF